MMGELPIEMEKAQKFMQHIYTIWDMIQQQGTSKKFAQYIDSGIYDVNAVHPQSGQTPLHIAVIKNKNDIVKLLI
jgi:ankyrin repeat protein